MPNLMQMQKTVEETEDAIQRTPKVVATQTLCTIAVLALVGALSVLSGLPWLTATLGASLLTQTYSPEQKPATMRNTFVGQFIGLGVGFAAVYIVGAETAAALASGQPLEWIRVAAVAVAFVLLIPIQQAIRAKHPPAGATALLLTLGIVPPTLQTAWVMAGGIAMVTVFGEAARLLVVRVSQGTAAVVETVKQKP